ncbi:unnamed protein product [Clonostachys rhizophaga]|uniref:Zn(2)-C6 fungal-type domain-containing protein n=1 Tax=Clonostachys rhizophaga TaxID=160324 RepID=A0A9N9VQM8_9HYPO|nr:unnamed protein product [Clonostachys rhizophaga]
MPPVRGKAACIACRSRKQKCNEKRPECSRCQALGIKCTWPTARRRGPAKGYTEALERRLGDTELALLQLLLVSNPETIESAFGPDTFELAQSIWANRQAKADSGEGRLEGERAEASLMAQWDNTSLKTADGINEWVNGMRHGEPETSADVSTDLRKSQQLPVGEQAPGQLPATVSHPNRDETRTPGEVCALRQSGVPTSHNSAPFRSDKRDHPGETADEPLDDRDGGSGVRGKIDLPAEFQSQFLW